MLKRIIFLTFIISFYASRLEAASIGSLPIESVFFNLGSHTEFYDAVQVDDSGGMRKFHFAPMLGAGVNFPLKYNWRFLPEVNWVLPFYDATSSRIIKNIWMLRADFGYDLVEWLRLRVGTSMMILNQHGRGGSVQIDNGNSTSTFYYPDENHSSINNTFDLGIELIWKDWSVRLQTYTYALFKKEQRQLSYSLLVTYDWDI